jgi:hypothetical protein
MYDVYSAAIKELYLPEAKGQSAGGTDYIVERRVVIKDHTIPYRWEERDDPTKRTQEWAKTGVEVDNSTVEDFKRKSKDSISLEPRFRFLAKQVLISDQELEDSFKNGRSWPGFYERYPNAGGIVTLSRVGFNPEHDQAFLYVGISCGRLCGGGDYVLLSKDGGVWSVKHKDTLWVS